MGKFLVILLAVCAIGAGAGMYYLQIYAFYEEVSEAEITLTQTDGTLVPLPTPGFEGIDANSSPIRFRACFDTDLTLAEAKARFEPYTGAAPRVAPGWFGCFDAEALGAQISAGQAVVLTGQRNLEYGIDRVVAITDAGRAYVWHEVNDCGDKLYDGSPKGTDCPPREEGQN